MSRLVAPSILAVWDRTGGNYEAVAEAARGAMNAGADWLHVDVMDGVYVPAKTFGPEMVEKLRGTGLLDVHLMVKSPELVVGDYVRAGADQIVFHPSVCADVGGTLRVIQDAGAIAGLALDTDEPIELLAPWADDVDQVLVMTVKAGAGGQSFMPAMLEKVKAVRLLVGPEVCIVVDGGVNPAVAQACWEAGVDCVVAGSAVFHREDWATAIRELNLTGA